MFSIALYLGAFALSIFFAYLGEKKADGEIIISYRGKRLRLISSDGRIWIFLSLLIPCIISGIRGDTVGVDVRGYVVNNYSFATRSGVDFATYLTAAPIKEEFLFEVLVYLCGKVGSQRLLLFCIQLFIDLPIYLVLIKRKVSLTAGLTVFYFLFYNTTLSMMRQGISASLLILAFYYFQEKKYIWAVVLGIAAVLFHDSAVVAIVMYAAVFLVAKTRLKRWIYMAYAIGIVMMIFIIQRHPNIFVRLTRLISENYYRYYSRLFFTHSTVVSTQLMWANMIIYMILIAFSFFVLYTSGKFVFKDSDLLGICIIGYSFLVLNILVRDAWRIGYYFNIFLTLLVGRGESVIENEKNKVSAFFVILLTCIVFWLYHYIYKNSFGTAEYVFS